MTDVFISYSKANRADIERLASTLQKSGLTVWWDTNLVAGENFRSIIKQALDAAKTVIVVWTETSIESEWVISEAQRGLLQKKLIPVKMSGVSETDIPQPFDIRHTVDIENTGAILTAVRSLLPAHQVGQAPSISESQGTQVRKHPIPWPARVIVGLVFLLLGLSFYVLPGAIILEHGWQQGYLLLASQSNLFIFFPIVGPLVLASMYAPTTALVDLYLRYIEQGILRLTGLSMVVVAISVFLANAIASGSSTAPWEISASALARDLGASEGAKKCGQSACRVSIGETLKNAATIYESRSPISSFIRACQPDALLPISLSYQENRFCAPAGKNLSGFECCQIQVNLRHATSALVHRPDGRSLAGGLFSLVSPSYIIFLVVILLSGQFVVIWGNKLNFIFPSYGGHIRSSLLIGACGMSVLPITDYGSLQVAELVFGADTASRVRASVIAVPWCAIMLWHFCRHMATQMQAAIVNGAISITLVLFYNFDQSIDIAIRALSLGMTSRATLPILAATSILGVIYIVYWELRQRGA